MNLTLLPTKQSTDILLSLMRECRDCHRMTYWFRNHEGRTRCIACVLDREEA